MICNPSRPARLLLLFAALLEGHAGAQASVAAEIVPAPTGRSAKQSASLPPAVLWLEGVNASTGSGVKWPTHGPYSLEQKNKMFSPHVLVVPVGATVRFPNLDPFFHNVFSLYNGRRFDLGLYESGSSREVRFLREGASYIFCNIHPDMSAVVLALRLPLWAEASSKGTLTIEDVPPGDYEAHLWIEGEDSQQLERWTQRVHVTSNRERLRPYTLTSSPRSQSHTNMFGQPYAPEPAPY